jgi:Transglutaminase-like superfamily
MHFVFGRSWLIGGTLALAMLALSLAVGCQQSAPMPGTANTTTQPAAVGIGEAGDRGQGTGDRGQSETFAEPPADDLGGGQLVQEFWDAFSMQGKRIGYARTTIAEVNNNGRELIRTSNYMRTEMQRSGQNVAQELTLTSWDTPQGEFVHFESRMLSPGQVVAVGAVKEGQLGIDVSTVGPPQSHKLPWQREWGGLFAPEQSLRKDPLKPGQSRTVRSLLPIFNIPGNTHLVAEAYESVDLPGGAARLLKVRAVLEVATQKIETILWVNEQGETLKSLVPGIGQESVRTTKADALRRSVGGQYDLLLASTVPLKGTLPDFQQAQRVVYRAHLKAGAIASLLADCPSQRVQSIDEQTADITVVTVRPNQPAKLDKASILPTDADQASNNFIQSDDSQIAAMAAHVEPRETDAWKLACAFEKFVDDTIRLKSFSQAFATAAEVCRSLEGDCTEHAVLMAALCRARKIPARVAFGLVYYPPEKGFAYHMWNEVWIADRWVPMDATLGQGGIGADHIKLGDSNLAGGSPLADLLSVIQVFGRLELEVIEAH